MAKLSIAHFAIIFIILNLVAGVIQVVVVDSDGKPIFDDTATGGYAFDTDGNYTADFSTDMQEEIQPSGSIDDASDQIARVLDMMSLGFISKFTNTIKKYMYGFTGMLDSIVGPMLNDAARTVIFGPVGA